jgi:hypothetical protein
LQVFTNIRMVAAFHLTQTFTQDLHCKDHEI